MENNSDYEKKYYNASLDEVLSKYITDKRYGEFAPIVKDIFQRRAYEFDFSDKHIEDEVKNFVKKAKKIEFASDEEFEKDTTMGVYKSGQKKIQLNKTYFSFKLRDYDNIDAGEMLYETLTHEVYHAISDRPNSMGVETYNYLKRSWEGAALNEVITEVSANRAAFSRTYKDSERGRSDTDGYSDITFVANLLAASIGVTEKEFLRAGLQNRKELMKVFNSKFPSNSIARTAKKEYFDKIEASLNMVYNLDYKKRDDDEPVEIRSQLRKSALTTLYKSAYELALFQISHDKSHDGISLADEASFRFLKMERIFVDSAKYFENKGYINRADADKMYDEVYGSRQQMVNKVLSLTGKKSYKDLDQYAISNNAYGQYILQEDFDNRRAWNNRDVAERMVDVFEKSFDVYHTEPIPIVEDSDRITEPVPVVDDQTEPMDTLDDTEEITEKISVLEKLNDTRKGLTDRFRQTVDIIITRFKNRNLAKLNQAREERMEDNSEYYASLVSNKDYAKQSEIDKYKVNVSSLHVENITVSTEERQDERIEDEER